jgi:hypothetical protein
LENLSPPEHVSGDFMNTALRKAIGPAFDLVDGTSEEH